MNLIKEPTSLKNQENSSYIDLNLTNNPHCFQNSYLMETLLETRSENKIHTLSVLE